MDKLLDNSWFVKVVALLLAFLLYSSVPVKDGSKLNEIYVPGDETTETIEDVPVSAYYDTKNLIVSGLPETVDVEVSGPKSHVQNAKTLKNFEVYVELSDAEVGNRNVKLKIRELSDKLDAKLSPSSANITIQERITREFRVAAEFDNSMVQDGFGTSAPQINPAKVKITGPRDEIERITYVKAAVDIKDPIFETTTRDAKIRVLDKDLNKLDVIVDPDTVKVTIPIKSLTKKVPINIVEKGSLPEGLILESMQLETKEAVITADESILEKTDAVRAEVNLSEITKNTTVTVPVIISDGISAVTPELVKITVKVRKSEQEVSLSALPVDINGLAEGNDVTFENPKNGQASLTVYGPSDRVKAINPDDFRLFIELTGLEEGRHNVEIKVEGPDGVSWRMAQSTATVTITNTEV
ncbi:hypothetical protein A8F94_23525 [Bacillus sp. FJAT-27225]|uniref:CdaR family protein n=1 Tax=Bacillus sp. FJAT-27225 TaxID=1743144 RepID=UPI00080C2976|nr:CdaR family protein [Bacillus sp. FJAT-27225]OCA89327.1 hypothetical protein A8F94_23525 [Bacillus sp. FJAT-27225]